MQITAAGGQDFWLPAVCIKETFGVVNDEICLQRVEL